MLVAVVATAALIGLAALALVMVGLRRQVRDLSEQVSALAAAGAGPVEAPDAMAAATPAPAASGPTPTEPQADPAEVAQSPAPQQQVPVITQLTDDRSDDLDLTTARVASVTLARPLIKVAALSHGVRRALGEEQRTRVRFAVHSELRRQRKLRRRRRAAPASAGWRP